MGEAFSKLFILALFNIAYNTLRDFHRFKNNLSLTSHDAVSRDNKGLNLDGSFNQSGRTAQSVIVVPRGDDRCFDAVRPTQSLIWT